MEKENECHYVKSQSEVSYAFGVSVSDGIDKFDACTLTQTVSGIQGHHAW
jgi:hypothetical protein